MKNEQNPLTMEPLPSIVIYEIQKRLEIITREKLDFYILYNASMLTSVLFEVHKFQIRPNHSLEVIAHGLALAHQLGFSEGRAGILDGTTD